MKYFQLSTFNFQTRGANRGFTLIETLIAILILAMTIGALLSLTAGGFFSIRYAKNDIVASNLLQESLEYIRNTRDSAAQEQGVPSWDAWRSQFDACFDQDGCMINPYAVSAPARVSGCGSTCDNLYYFPGDGFYAYPPVEDNVFNTTGSEESVKTSFIRTITMEEGPSGTDIIVTATMQWMNGTNTKQTKQSIILSQWNLQ
ncbi:MAG: prepilin-type N-terminal cleavage/methylation domain-containing protein [Candidatus Pacebacteria bacterium]|nr:prepilin-type N-terminal cleavage/methylation domain-containing protein [Candidatus Paceibacterota bacterium]MBP9701224.1 prepilin-type N-terminal cleavage/methylation domain-containing protein [Candidatus Paceibacterota bacterium]